MKRDERKKTKAGESASHPNPDHHGTSEDKCRWDGNARVSGEILVKAPPDFFEKYKAAHDQGASNPNKARLVDWLTLAAVVIYAGLTGWQGCETHTLVTTAQDTFEAANRPYVGVSAINTSFIPAGTTESSQFRRTPNAKSVEMLVSAEIKNFGPVPATNETDGWRVYMNGVIIPQPPTHIAPTTIFPTQPTYLRGTVGGADYTAIEEGTEIMILEIWVDYSGPSGEYKECRREQYSAKDNGFRILGNECKVGG